MCSIATLWINVSCVPTVSQSIIVFRAVERPWCVLFLRKSQAIEWFSHCVRIRNALKSKLISSSSLFMDLLLWQWKGQEMSSTVYCICSIRRRGYYLFHRPVLCGVYLRAATNWEWHLLISVNLTLWASPDHSHVFNAHSWSGDREKSDPFADIEPRRQID